MWTVMIIHINLKLISLQKEKKMNIQTTFKECFSKKGNVVGSEIIR